MGPVGTRWLAVGRVRARPEGAENLVHGQPAPASRARLSTLQQSEMGGCWVWLTDTELGPDRGEVRRGVDGGEDPMYGVQQFAPARTQPDSGEGKGGGSQGEPSKQSVGVVCFFQNSSYRPIWRENRGPLVAA